MWGSDSITITTETHPGQGNPGGWHSRAWPGRSQGKQWWGRWGLRVHPQGTRGRSPFLRAQLPLMGHCSIWTQTQGSRPPHRAQPVAHLLPDGFLPGVFSQPPSPLEGSRAPQHPAQAWHTEVLGKCRVGMNDLRVRTHGVAPGRQQGQAHQCPALAVRLLFPACTPAPGPEARDPLSLTPWELADTTHRDLSPESWLSSLSPHPTLWD